MKRLLLVSAIALAPLGLALSVSPAAACGGWGQAPCPKATLTVVPMNQPAKPAPKAAAPTPVLAKTQLQPALGTTQNSSVIGRGAQPAPLLSNNSGTLISNKPASVISNDGGSIYSPGVRNGFR